MKNLRNKLGITQQELADYLQVERSILTKHEGGNKRLPYEAMQKLRTFEIAINRKHNGALSNAAQESLKKLSDAAEKKLKREKNNLLVKAAQTERELQKAQKNYQASLKSLAVIHQLLQNISMEEQSADDNHLLQMMEKKALKKLSLYNPASQAVLQARLIGYRAMIVTIDEIKNSKTGTKQYD